MDGMLMGLEQIKVELLSSWQGSAGGDGTIAHAAWASSIDVEKLSTKTPDDIRRVATNVVTLHHDTPKERLWMEFFLTVPIYVERQFDKYRMTIQYQDFQIEFLERPMGGDHITQNELSGRYRTLPERFIEMPNDVSSICSKAMSLNKDSDVNWAEDWHDILSQQHAEYRDRIGILKHAEQSGKITNTEYKRAREFLRGICGTATMTDMRIVMNFNAFEHIINQRLEPVAQLESRVAAYLMVEQALKNNIAPVALPKMMEVNGWTPWYWEVHNILKGEIEWVQPQDQKLTPNELLWVEILSQDTSFDVMEYDDIREELKENNFPESIIREFLQRKFGGPCVAVR